MNTVILYIFLINILITINIPSIQSFNNYEKYKGYKIYEISFHNEQQYLKFYEHFKKTIDVIIPNRTIERPMSVLISPSSEYKIVKYLKSNDQKFHISNENVAESIRNENKHKTSKLFSTTAFINFQSYQRFDVINNYLEYLQEQYPERINVTNIGKSYEGRDLKTVLVTNGTQTRESSKKPLILIDAGIHAREWISPATALYVIQQLVENSTYYQEELNTYDWLVWPMVNPDGYEYSHDYDRLWRKTRRPADPLSNCVGVDLNRNFDYYWAYSGVSNYSCADNYPGLEAFSEPEAIVLRDLLFSINSTCQMYLTLHSYGNYLLYPWGYDRLTPSSWKYLDAVARAGASAIKMSSGTSYTVGGAANVLYPAAGASDDFAFAIANISVVLCMELPSGGNGFDPPSEDILAIVEESWLGIRAMAVEVNEYPLRNMATCSFRNLSVLIFSLCILFMFNNVLVRHQ